MSEPRYVKEFRAEIAEMKRRQNEIDRNTINHLDRILENQRAILHLMGDQIGPAPSAPPSNPDPLPVTERRGLQAVRDLIGNHDLVWAGSELEHYYNQPTRDMWEVDNRCIVINEKFPDSWRTGLKVSVAGIVRGQLHALGGQGV